MHQLLCPDISITKIRCMTTQPLQVSCKGPSTVSSVEEKTCITKKNNNNIQRTKRTTNEFNFHLSHDLFHMEAHYSSFPSQVSWQLHYTHSADHLQLSFGGLLNISTNIKLLNYFSCLVEKAIKHFNSVNSSCHWKLKTDG